MKRLDLVAPLEREVGRQSNLSSRDLHSCRILRKNTCLALIAGTMLWTVGRTAAEDRPDVKKWVASWASAMQGAYIYYPPPPLNSPYHLYSVNPDLPGQQYRQPR